MARSRARSFSPGRARYSAQSTRILADQGRLFWLLVIRDIPDDTSVRVDSSFTEVTQLLHSVGRQHGFVNNVIEPSGPSEVSAATPYPPPGSGPEGQGPPGGLAPPPGYAPPPGPGTPPGYGWAGWPEPGPSASSSVPSGSGRRGVSGILRNVTAAWIVAGVLALTVAGLSAALASGSSGPARVSRPFGGFAPGSGRSFGGSPAFSGGNFSSLGVFGTVASVGTGSFTVTDRSDQTVTVDEQSSTTYYSGATSTSSSAVVTGARVVVQGTRSGDTVTATRITVLPARSFGAGPLS